MKTLPRKSPTRLVRGNEFDLSTEDCAALFADGDWAKTFPPVLTVDQAAQLLQVPKKTVYAWSSRGLLKQCSKRVGKHLRILRNRLIQMAFQKGITFEETK